VRLPLATRQSLGAVAVKPHPHLDAEVAWNQFKTADLARTLHDAFGERKADAEILQIGRRRHHHRMGRSVVAERDRGLFGDEARGRHGAAATPGDLLMLTECRAGHL
jgi:hypothetical protein